MATNRHATILPPAPMRASPPIWLALVPRALLALAALAAFGCCAALLAGCLSVSEEDTDVLRSTCSSPMPAGCICHYDGKQHRSVDYCQAGAGPAGDGGTRPRRPSILVPDGGAVGMR